MKLTDRKKYADAKAVEVEAARKHATRYEIVKREVGNELV